MNEFMQTLSWKLDCQEAEFLEGLEGNKSETISYAQTPTFEMLKKRGYVNSFYKGLNVWMKGFVCIVADDNMFTIWHDTENTNKQVINKSILTHLPIVLNYMERING